MDKSTNYSEEPFNSISEDFLITPDIALELAYNHFGKTLTKTSTDIAEPLTYEGKDVAYYVNMQEGGWAIVSGDKRMQTILAFNKKGHFDPDSLDYAPMLWLNDICSELYLLKSSDKILLNSSHLKKWQNKPKTSYVATKGDVENHDGEWLQEVYVKRDFVTENDVNHLLLTSWGQNYPWNSILPFRVNPPPGEDERVAAGCVNVALAQLCYYLHNKIGLPSSVPIVSCSGNEESCRIDLLGYENLWDFMALSYPDSLHTDYQSVYNLIAGILVLVQIQHNNQNLNTFMRFWDFITSPNRNFGSAERSDVKGFLNQQWIQCSQWQLFNAETVSNELMNDRPVLISSYNNSIGHAWLIDGCFKRSTYDTFFRKWMPIGTFPSVEPEEPDYDNLEQYVISDPVLIDTEYFFLMNWGFGQKDDTYYYYGSNWTVSIDDGGLYNATHDRRILYGFEPMYNH